MQEALLELARRVARLEAEAELLRPPAGVELVGESAPFVRALHRVRSIALAGGPALLSGEAGAGKAALARYLHRQGEGPARPMVVFPCGMAADEGAVSALGQPTALLLARPGREAAALAGGGTLFLRDVDRLSAETQARLAGALAASRVRVVASIGAGAAADLQRELLATFGTHVVEVPPLRRRAGDVRLLAAHFARREAERRRGVALDESSLVELEAHPWPGNVRELELVIERASYVGSIRRALGA